MLSLHTNAAALSAQNSLGASQRALSTSMARLSTGLRVNSAMDDAAGLQIATRLDAQSRGMSVAMRNTQNGISMMQTAEGAFGEVTDILLRMKDLATESATASTTAADRTAMQAEFNALGKELGNIVKNTSFGGTKLFSDGVTTSGAGGMLSTSTLTFQIGASTGETMAIDTSTSLVALGTALNSVSVNYGSATATGAELSGTNSPIGTIDSAIKAVGTLRSELGAASNRLNHVYNNLQNITTNTDQAKGRIMDVDYASETSKMTTKQMLMQAGSSMLKQSNSMSGLVMSLLQ